MCSQEAAQLGRHQVGGVRAEVLDLALPALQQPIGRDPRQAPQEVGEGGGGAFGVLAIAVDDACGDVLRVAVAVANRRTEKQQA